MARRLAALVSALPLTYAGMALTPDARRPADAVAEVGHRGASAYAPENTLASFRAAKTKDADYFELDVQQTKDGVPIVIHDTTLSRTTDAETRYPNRSPWRVRDFTLGQIERLDAGSWFSARFRDERVPTLAATLRAMEGSDLRLLLELKNPSLYPGLTRRVVERLRADPDWLLPDRLIVQSFDWASVQEFHRLMPAVQTAVLGTPATARLTEIAHYARYVNPRSETIDAAYVRQVHAHRMKVFAWNADSQAVMERLVDDRVDGIIADRPETVPR
jgi:glycerophosphoryl diester phosphodiesterase